MDNHLHTIFSDGEDTPRDMVLTAIELGYKQITFTDHVRRNSDWLERYISEISNLKDEFRNRIDINCGVEAKIINLNGDIDFDNHYRKKIDVVLAAMHRIPVGDEQYINSTEIANSNKEEIFNCIEKATFNALKNSSVDILAHPFQFGIMKQYVLFFSTEYCNRLRCHAIQYSKYIEFNYSKYNKCVQKDYWKYPSFKVWVGSDSHSIIDLKKNTLLLKNADFL